MTSSHVEATVSFSAQINQGTSEALIEGMQQEVDRGVERVVLEVSTPGGEVASGMMLYNALRSLNAELVTHNTSEVASIGNMLFLAGDTRLAYPESTFLLHPVAFDIGGRRLNMSDFTTLRAEVEHSQGDPWLLRELDLGVIRLQKEDRAVQAVLQERTNLSGPEITALIHDDRPFDASYALRAGIVHEIVPAPSRPA